MGQFRDFDILRTDSLISVGYVDEASENYALILRQAGTIENGFLGKFTILILESMHHS